MDDTTIKSYSNKGSMIMIKRNEKPKKTVSFRESDRLKTLGNYKLFYQTGFYKEYSKLKSILKVNKSSSFRVIKKKSLKETISSDKTAYNNTNNNENSNSNSNNSNNSKKCVFKDPLTEVKLVDSISHYYKADNKNKKSCDEERARCGCSSSACLIF